MKKILIVGGVAGGASAAARIRRLDEKANIIIFEKGEYISFANCGLPYYIGGEIKEKSALTLQTPESFNKRFNVDVMIFNEVIGIDKKNKKVKVKNLITNEEYEEGYDSLILSMGADPIKADIFNVQSNRIFTLRNIPDTYKIKDYVNAGKVKKAAVIGGGFIGLEMAENLKNLDVDVSLIEMSNQILPPIDYDMACEAHKYIKDNGINLLLNTKVEEIKEVNESLDIKTSNGNLEVDMLILAIGVRPESKIAREANLNVSEKGLIIVNDNMQTSDENIYAVGDIIEITNFLTGKKGFVPLAGPANKQGRIAADNICGIKSKYKGTQGSSILKMFDMAIGSTGLNEKQAKEANIDYEKSFTFSQSHASYYPGGKGMSIKTIFEKKTGKILGAQIIGFDGVDKRLDVFATAIRANMTAYDLTELELCYAPPFSSAKDPVNMAGYVIENILENKVKVFHHHDIEALQKKDDVILLDTRTKKEYEQGHIEGFINIPVDELRARLDELDINKTIYETCQIGLRGYLSSRILSQNGFNVFNLSGGYRLYKTIY